MSEATKAAGADEANRERLLKKLSALPGAFGVLKALDNARESLIHARLLAAAKARGVGPLPSLEEADKTVESVVERVDAEYREIVDRCKAAATSQQTAGREDVVAILTGLYERTVEVLRGLQA